MKTVFHRADSRGEGKYAWLHAFYSFSFANYYNPERMGFGALLVLNDDTIQPGQGFPLHPHQDMEIITIPLLGQLRHGDSLGHESVITPGMVQVMSAGTGIVHSEYNASQTEALKLLQIWLKTKRVGIKPQYADRVVPGPLLVSPDGVNDSLAINQEAWISQYDISRGEHLVYTLKQPKNGLYLFVISGQLLVGDILLSERDGLAISDTTEVRLEGHTNTRVLCLEVPLQ